MAVPKRRTSKSRRGMRRSHHRAFKPTIVYCECGAPKLPHSVCPECGKYRDREYLEAEENEGQ